MAWDNEDDEPWHWERAGDERRNAVVWMLVSPVILGFVYAVVYWIVQCGH